MPDEKLKGFTKRSFADTISYSIIRHSTAFALQGQNLVGEFRFRVENSRRESPLRGAQNANVLCRHVNRATVSLLNTHVEHIMYNHAPCATKKSSTRNFNTVYKEISSVNPKTDFGD
jgi:hypothetical protein